MDGLTPEMIEAVKRNLPAQTVGVLQQELEELNRLRDTKDKLTREELAHAETRRLLGEANKELARYKAREEALAKAELANREASILLENTILKIKLEEACKRADVVTDLSKTVFRNSVVQESIYRNYLNGGNPFISANGASAEMPETSSTRTVVRE